MRTETAGLSLKNLFELSTLIKKNMTKVISNMYLNSPLDQFKYTCMLLTNIQEGTIDK